MAHNNSRDHSAGGGGQPPTIPSPYDPSHFQRSSYSPLRDPRDWNRLPPPGHSLSTLAGEPAFGNRFRTDNNSWRPLTSIPLSHPINLHTIPPNVEYMHHWNRPPFLRPDVQERSEEPETKEEPRPHRTQFGTVESMRSSEQAVHQHFEESFRLAQQKGVWRSPLLKEETEKASRLSMLGPSRPPPISASNPGPQLKAFEPLPARPKLDLQQSPKIQSGRAQSLHVPPSRLNQMTPPFSHTSDNNFAYHNERERAREIISPPVLSDRIHFGGSSGNHGAKGNPVQGYVTGPLHRIKVSSPAPPQIYGKPGIPPYNAPSARNYDSLNDVAPLSLTSKVSTRPSEALPHVSPFTGHQNHGLKNVGHYMFSPSSSSIPGRSYNQAPTSPLNPQNHTDPEYQTQPLDLGGKRKSNSEPINLNVKKVRNESRPEQGVHKTYYAAPAVIDSYPIYEPAAKRFSSKSSSGSLNLSKEEMKVPVMQVNLSPRKQLNANPYPDPYLSTIVSNVSQINPIQNLSQGHVSSIGKNEPNDNVPAKVISLERDVVKTPEIQPEKVEPEVRPLVTQVESVPSTSVDTSRNSSSYPVHKLKKAWLDRLTGEDIKTSSDSSSVTPSSTKTGCESPAQISVEHGSPRESLTNKSGPPVESKEFSQGSIRTGAPSPLVMNRVPHMRKKALLRARSMAGLTNGHDNRSMEPSSSDSDSDKVPVKRPRPKGKRKPAKEKKDKPSGSMSESAKDSEESRDGETQEDKASAVETCSGGDGSPLLSAEFSTNKKKGRKPTDAGESPSRSSSDKKKPNPFRRLHINLLKKTGVSFLQDGSCNEVAPKLGKCRECRWSPSNRSKKKSNIFCRFYAFRKLRYTKNGVIAIAGFSDPVSDPTEEDTRLWLPSASNQARFDIDTAKFLIAQIGDQFCDVIRQEKEALELNAFQSEKPIAWKRVVQGVQEMCDVCDTTLFNFHWACGKCGFVVCIPCYRSRKHGTSKVSEEAGKDRDNFQWLLCSNRQGHEDDKLMLTQAIANDAMNQITNQLHKTKSKWKIPQNCQCQGNQQQELHVDENLKREKNGLNSKEQILQPKNETGSELTENLPRMTNPASENNNDAKKISKTKISKSSDTEDDGDEGHSTLRELLIRPSPKKDPDTAPSKQNGVSTEVQGISEAETLSKITPDESAVGSLANNSKDQCDRELSNIFNRPVRENDNMATLTNTLSETRKLHPTVPHSWLCDGRLLHLHESDNPGNCEIFKQVWKRGQPVIVSKVLSKLNSSLWTADSLCRDMGDWKNDLTDFLTGNVISSQPATKFWEGFVDISKRPKNDNGKSMLLKFKEWPYEEDFAEIMPSRFNDLLNGLPLSDYTHRSGRYNLAAGLPENFVKPDLGPKLYIGYGSGLQLDKGTRSLHVDLTDVVNILVHVGVPADCDSGSNNEDVLSAISESDCDGVSSKRIKFDNEQPGALWHIYNTQDAGKIRDLLNKVSKESGNELEGDRDPMQDPNTYLDKTLRKRLKEEYGVMGYATIQCLGDAILIPAGAPHQVRNLHSCVKIVKDFISPESISNSFRLTEDLTNKSGAGAFIRDRLQIKSVIYHAVKDALSVLSFCLPDDSSPNESEQTKAEDNSLKVEDIPI